MSDTMLPQSSGDDLFVFTESAHDEHVAGNTLPPWRILIVDDEPDVHDATTMALNDLVFEGRRLRFDHAYTAHDAEKILAAEGSDFSVLLLDVVMETADAGLRLARTVREDLGLGAVRIILRTGQPGYAPELDTIRAYDINDYKSKGDLTRTRLHTCVVAALRSYAQVRQLEASRRGLEKIVAASNELGRERGLRRFAEGVVTQICALLDIPAEGLVCVHSEAGNAEGAEIIAAAGQFASLIHRPLKQLPDEAMRTMLARCIAQRQHAMAEHTPCLYFPTGESQGIAVCIAAGQPLKPLDEDLLHAFSANIAVGFDNVALNERMASLALTDQLLGIPNRTHFIQIIDEKLVQPSTQMLGLIDIDDFSSINATLDQHFGDRVLQAVARRLVACFGKTVTVGRIASDCFGVLGSAAAINIELIQTIFGDPFEIDGESLRLSVTSGFVRLQGTRSNGADLLKDASIALKQAKTTHRGKAQFFSPDLRTAARDRMQLLNSLRTAFSAERLFVVYQPQVSLPDQKIVGLEALLRWRTEAGEFVPPERFIPLAEQSGVIVPIGEWVARTACAELRRLIDRGHADLRMAINVSHAQFREPGFVDRLATILTEYRVPPSQVEVELTESVAAEDVQLVVDRLTALKTLGVSIAIDDFGTGYSSLSILNQLPVDRIKIDRSFVGELAGADAEHNIVSLIAGLGRQLSLVTIAEGVETPAQRERLLAMGCQEGQGYLFARPMEATALAAWLDSHAVTA